MAIHELSCETMRGTQQFNYERFAFESAARTSAEYLIANFLGAKDHVVADKVRQDALAQCTVDGLMLEFGVFSGRSIKTIAATTTQTVHGFDSWEGLPEKWTHWQESGRFSTGGQLPDVSEYPNISLHKGWFENTLPAFLETHPGPIRFLHVDCDLYSSTKTILTLCESRIVPGTVILFDEYLNYPGWQQHEYKAWQEFIARTGMHYKYLGFASGEFAVSTIVEPEA